MPDIATSIKAQVEAAGGRFNATGPVDLLTVKRSLLGWVSQKIQNKIGVPAKPAAGSQCPVCRQNKQAFQLDHMGPWRVYVAATGGGNITVSPNGELLIDRATLKALYNDPENLWWVCSDCNLGKSDQVYDTAAQLQALQAGIVPAGPKRVDPAIVYA